MEGDVEVERGQKGRRHRHDRKRENWWGCGLPSCRLPSIPPAASAGSFCLRRSLFREVSGRLRPTETSGRGRLVGRKIEGNNHDSSKAEKAKEREREIERRIEWNEQREKYHAPLQSARVNRGLGGCASHHAAILATRQRYWKERWTL